MRTSARPVTVDSRVGVVVSACAAGLSCVTVLVTVALVARELAEPQHLPDSDAPLAAAVLLAIGVAAVPAATLTLGSRPLEAVGLASAGIATCLPLWAGWTFLPPDARTAALAAGPVAAGGFALIARSRAGAALAVAAGAFHALSYNPFRDPGCVRVCLDVPARLDLATATVTRTVALLLLAAAALTVIAAVSVPTGPSRAAAFGALLLAGLAVVRWWTTGDAETYARLLLAAPAVPGLVALPWLLGWARRTGRRHRVRRLVDALSTDPAIVRALSNVDPRSLTPGELLAWRNAELLALARARAADIRSSQRRIVAAADAERHRIERDLHDGAQQRLVGVLMQLPGLGLEAVDSEVRGVLDDLRHLGDGGFPRVLRDEGLVAALEELASGSDARVRLALPPRLDVDPERARAVYALVAGTAAGGEVTVTLRPEQDRLEVLVQGAAARGPTEDVADRFGALGGRVEVRADGLLGVLPCAW